MNEKTKSRTAAGIVLILSAFMCGADAMVLQPIIDLLATKVFPQYGYATVSLLMTVSTIALFIISFASGFLTKLGKKKLLIIGSILFTVGGCAGALITNFYFILFTRIIEGLGTGLCLSVSMMLIPALFPSEEETNKWMGYNGVLTSLFTGAVGFLAGFLAEANWKLPFAFYALGIIILILQIAILPNDKELSKASEGPAQVSKVSKGGIILAIDVFVFALITSFFFVFTSGIVAENGIGGPALAGTVVTVNTVGSFLLGFFFAKLYGKFKQWYPVIIFVFIAVGLLLLIGAHSLGLACVAAFIHGAFYQQFFSYFLAKVAQISDERSLDANMGLVNGIFYGGQFCTSFLAMLVAKIGGTDSSIFALKFEVVCIIILAVIHVIAAIKESASKKAANA